MFIHHSVGRQIIRQGQLRHRLSGAVPSLELWDHDYNAIGLSGADGAPLGAAFPIPDDDTDPGGLCAVLGGVRDGDLWAERMTTCDLLMVKSCFPNNAIRSDRDAAALRGVYQDLKAIALSLPQPVLLISSPPLVLESTRPSEAARAADLAEWLGSHWVGPGLGYADIFRALTYRRGPARGTLRLRYRVPRRADSHLAVTGAQAAAHVIVPAVCALL